MYKNVAVIILAAGKSTRMNSSIPKVLHPVCCRPMLGFTLDLVKDLKIRKAAAVLGYKQGEVAKLIPSSIKIAVQKKLLGTADAVRAALPLLKGFQGAVLVLYGDNPLLTKDTVKKLLDYHMENKPEATLLTAKVDKPAGYGRIIRDKYSSISRIVEEKDADEYQKDIKEINTGIMCFNKDALSGALSKIKINKKKKEYYLTDAVEILYKKGCVIDSVNAGDINEAHGINTRSDLARANRIMQQKINEDLMKRGVTIIDPASTFIGYGAKIGKDSKIYPFTVIESNVKIGKCCSVGPFAHLRDGTLIEDDVVIGNFLEIVRSNLSAKTLVKHFGYIGDSRIGKNVNIGAGCVTANFDGKEKNVTVIQDKAFIGSDTVLVAPVKVGRGAKTGAGAVLTKNKNVPAGVTVVGIPARPIRKNKT